MRINVPVLVLILYGVSEFYCQLSKGRNESIIAWALTCLVRLTWSNALRFSISWNCVALLTMSWGLSSCCCPTQITKLRVKVNRVLSAEFLSLLGAFRWPGGVVASTFDSHADDRGSIPSGNRFGWMQVAHQTMVWMVVVLIRAMKITQALHMSGVVSRLCCGETCTERTVAAPQKKRRLAPRS